MKKEQKFLLDKANESLQAARLLHDNHLLTIAASRAYYVMFYVAQAFLLKEELSYSKHSAVISNFGRIFAKTQRVPSNFHRYLINAQEQRTEADYALKPEIESEAIAKIIAQAEEMLDFAKARLY
jgi:uncharacterized protein (UPF0332 family)